VPELVLDNVALRVMAFSHPDGINILLGAFDVSRASFPAEVYNQDQDAIPPGADDTNLSELARGLRYAARQSVILPAAKAERYLTWLRNAAQLASHLSHGTLIIDPLTVNELPLRERLSTDHGIGRGEAACLVLAQRYGTAAVFLSSDAAACQVAIELGLPSLTLQDMLTNWVSRLEPTVAELDELLAGMSQAKFRLTQSVIDDLKRQATL
jgi:predicted nucleic acid-binding protein